MTEQALSVWMCSFCRTWIYLPGLPRFAVREGGLRYQADERGRGSASLPELMAMDVNTALEFCKNMKGISQKLNVLRQLGLGYLTLGEETPGLSGGEAHA